MQAPVAASLSSKRKKPLYLKLGRKLLDQVDAFIARNSLVGDPAFFDVADFDWVKPLEANWQTIRAELDQVMLGHQSMPSIQDVSEDQKHITQDDQWKTYFLYGYGYSMPEHCRQCPETTKLIEAVPGMSTAFFSILSPGKHINAHRGPYKGVIRYHLGLIVPEPREQCRIRVGSGFASWQEGKSIMFDDTNQHEVWNDTDGIRVVLFLDVERPMRFPASLVNKAAFTLIKLSPFVQRARYKIINWTALQKKAAA